MGYTLAGAYTPCTEYRADLGTFFKTKLTPSGTYFPWSVNGDSCFTIAADRLLHPGRVTLFFANFCCLSRSEVPKDKRSHDITLVAVPKSLIEEGTDSALNEVLPLLAPLPPDNPFLWVEHNSGTNRRAYSYYVNMQRYLWVNVLWVGEAISVDRRDVEFGVASRTPLIPKGATRRVFCEACRGGGEPVLWSKGELVPKAVASTGEEVCETTPTQPGEYLPTTNELKSSFTVCSAGCGSYY